MRRFKRKGDKEKALEALYSSDAAMDKAKALANFHAQVRKTYGIFVSGKFFEWHSVV